MIGPAELERLLKGLADGTLVVRLHPIRTGAQGAGNHDTRGAMKAATDLAATGARDVVVSPVNPTGPEEVLMQASREESAQLASAGAIVEDSPIPLLA